MTGAIIKMDALAALDRRGFLKSAGALIVGFSMSGSEARAQFGNSAIPGSPPNASSIPGSPSPPTAPLPPTAAKKNWDKASRPHNSSLSLKSCRCPSSA